LVLLAFLPFLWVLITEVAGGNNRVFMGALHDYSNSAVHLSQLYQGAQDRWLIFYLHTPETHAAALIDPVYALIGQVARLTTLSEIVIFHVARVGAGLFMLMALYQLAASIWMRIRTRRIFFVLVGMASGLGWLFAAITGDSSYLDLSAPSVFPFYSLLSNVHLPLTVAALALLSSVVIMVVRPDATPMPSVQNGGVLVFTLSLILVFLYPLAFLPFSIAFVFNTIYVWWDDRSVNKAQANWLLWLIAPALPMLLYYLLMLQSDSTLDAIWRQAASTAPPDPLVLILSFGIPLFLAIPGIYRAMRRFERDGDQFMLIWLVSILLSVYLPTVARTSFFVGVMIPLIYFSTRAIEDFWFKHIPRRWWLRVGIALLPIMFASNITVMLSPLILIDNNSDDNAILLQPDYLETFRWFVPLTSTDDLIVSAPDVGLWLPGWTGARVLYGNASYTLEANKKYRVLMAWYAIDDRQACDINFFTQRLGRDYHVDYVIYGPREEQLGPAVCRDLLQPIIQIGSVRVYRYLNSALTVN